MKIGDWESLEPEVVAAMIEAGGNFAGVNSYLDLGSGDGRMLDAALTIPGITTVHGIEIESSLAQPCIDRGLDVTIGDFFDYAHIVKNYDLFTAWFTDEVGTLALLDMLYANMKNNKYLVYLYDSYRSHRNLPEEGIPPHVWQPSQTIEILRNRFHVYVR